MFGRKASVTQVSARRFAGDMAVEQLQVAVHDLQQVGEFVGEAAERPLLAGGIERSAHGRELQSFG